MIFLVSAIIVSIAIFTAFTVVQSHGSAIGGTKPMPVVLSAKCTQLAPNYTNSELKAAYDIISDWLDYCPSFLQACSN